MADQRYKMKIAYDGTDFSGFQIQPNERTIQGELEKALSKMAKNTPIRIHAAGRTDAGVHALGQVLHFDFPIDIPDEGIIRGLNTLLPASIRVLACKKAKEDFHSRYLAKGKTYEYRIDNSKIQNPFRRHYTHHHSYPMNFERAEKALKYFEGTHDFSSFASTKTDKEDKVRTIYEVSVEIDPQTEEWVFTFKGNGFLYNMIRVIMGTVVKVADGRRPLEDIPRILNEKDRNRADATLEAKGLCMMKVFYEAPF